MYMVSLQILEVLCVLGPVDQKVDNAIQHLNNWDQVIVSQKELGWRKL